MTRFKKAVAATAGLVTGGLVTLMALNAAYEDKRGSDVFSGHENHNFYAIDTVNAVICASISYALASCWERKYTTDVDFGDVSRLDEPPLRETFLRQPTATVPNLGNS